ncbi:MAG: DUF4476 domain-containing protein [Flavobacteriales bacterium]|nr:DUF4476 domain-containing protein [Flavobacteriales bacterium]NCG30422.1 DUF4476 domain-containing protein [Bacteroidota bacterium]MBT3962572.1 DUF4476 domain-containing protein [Flavobacteriales bacterium]MBT4705207.1 DUF4476 domain-containing protein [Flavobacteriales bacterium]MBT4930377.1 DUF4476 domain-containing protein [Flavobacteriales bacterium]
MIKVKSIKIAFVGMIVFLSLGSSASSFNLRMAHPGIYDVYIDGQVFTVRGNQLELNHLNPGIMEIQIVRHSRDPRRNPRAASRLVFREMIRIPAHTRIQARFGRQGMDIDYMPLRRNHPTQCVVETKPYTSPVYGMHSQDFDRLMFDLDQTAFDQTKISIARAAIRNNGITTDQMAIILESVSFDSRRLELAKYAYQYCVDPMNYYQLAGTFTFDSNARRLMQYIG